MKKVYWTFCAFKQLTDNISIKLSKTRYSLIAEKIESKDKKVICPYHYDSLVDPIKGKIYIKLEIMIIETF